MASKRPFTTGGENDPGVSVDGPLRGRALARMATTGIYLLRGVSRGLQRTARARAVSEGTTLRRVLVHALHEYAAGTWTPRPDDLTSESPAAATPLEPRDPPRLAIGDDEVMNTSPDKGTAPRFIQICASQNDLFALDGEGSIYQYNFTSQTWQKLVASRSDESPARGDRASRGGSRPAFP